MSLPEPFRRHDLACKHYYKDQVAEAEKINRFRDGFAKRLASFEEVDSEEFRSKMRGLQQSANYKKKKQYEAMCKLDRFCRPEVTWRKLNEWRDCLLEWKAKYREDTFSKYEPLNQELMTSAEATSPDAFSFQIPSIEQAIKDFWGKIPPNSPLRRSNKLSVSEAGIRASQCSPKDQARRSMSCSLTSSELNLAMQPSTPCN